MPTKEEKQPLSVTHPELAKEADGWDPTGFSAGSDKKLKRIYAHSVKYPIYVEDDLSVMGLTGSI